MYLSSTCVYNEQLCTDLLTLYYILFFRYTLELSMPECIFWPPYLVSTASLECPASSARQCSTKQVAFRCSAATSLKTSTSDICFYPGMWSVDPLNRNKPKEKRHGLTQNISLCTSAINSFNCFNLALPTA